MFNDVQSIVIQTQAQFYAKGIIINHSLNYSSVACIYFFNFFFLQLGCAQRKVKAKAMPVDKVKFTKR